MEQMEKTFDYIRAIAQICEGYGTLTDRQGVRLRTYDSNGEERLDMRGQVYDLAEQAGRSQSIQIGYSQIVAGAQTWAVPWGDYVVSAGNVVKMERDLELLRSLLAALPFIARVVGGEVVIFDKEGKRIRSVEADGSINKDYEGSVSVFAKEAMQKQTPIFGESISTQGAIAVRIPITKDYGFGFNNELVVKKEKRLFEEVKKFQYAKYNLQDIIGCSEKIRGVKHLCIAASKASSILLTGETGTGKELFAQAIHNESERRSKPFIAINCGAIPASIIESYLFGYSGGAFTGAKKEGNIGAFEQANHGTIFLDEISEMPLDLQIKLLRVIQEKEVMRLGDFKPIKLDIRIISATNRDLLEAINQGRFREDLYYRINVIEIKIPPLREHKEDIPLLVQAFVGEFNKILGKFVLVVDDAVYELLKVGYWRGNIRELKSCIERAMSMINVNESVLRPEHLPPYLLDVPMEGKKSGTQSHPFACLRQQVMNTEMAAIRKALILSNHSKKAAAELLGISTITLWRKIKEYSL